MPKQEAKQIIIADSPQNVTSFIPTASMKVWLDTAINLATDSPEEISKASNVARQTWYKWLDIPQFEDWYYESYKLKRKRWLPALDNIGLKHAKKGDYNFWRDMNKKAGETLDSVTTNVNVAVMNQIKKDKEEFDL